MVAAGLVLVLAIGATPPPEQTPHLSKAAAALLRPVLSEFLAAHAEEFDSEGRYIKESPHSAVFERRLQRLLETRGAAADEAIAALMSFYIGEHAAEELMCAALQRGKRMVPFLRRFLRTPPTTGLEPIALFFTNIPNSREAALARIRANEGPCEFE